MSLHGEGLSADEMIGRVEEAVAAGRWLVITFHGVGEGHLVVERPEFLAAVHVPQFHRTVRRCAGQAFAVGAEDHAPDAAGMTLECQRCGKPTPVPAIPTRQTESAKAQSQLADLERQLTENESQRTEINGYINQLSIQLHRWQLRLQTLNERQKELESELRAK